MEQEEKNNNWIGWVIAIVIIYGISSLFGSDESVKSEYIPSSNYNTANSINSINTSSYGSKEDDGYSWAENNDISSFVECQDQFGTGSEEDECNRYVKENYSGDKSFSGYECTEDCSGHEAGYDWAEENNIDDEYDCDGNSNSFNEGCTAYVEENY